MAKGGGGNTTVQKADPWIGQQPYLKKGFQSAEGDVLQGPLPYAPMDPAMTQGLGMQEQRALAGSPLLGQAQDVYSGILSSDPYSGPAAEAAQNYVMSSVMPTVDSRFALGNRTGSGLHGEAIGRGAALGLTPFMESQMNRQLQAAAGAPAMAMADYQDPSMLTGVGQQRQAQAQGELDAPYNRLARYMGLIQGNYGGATTQTGGLRSSPLLGALGGAGLGAGIGSMMAGPGATGLAALGGPLPLLLGGGLGLLGSL